jgi:hypothetical protein
VVDRQVQWLHNEIFHTAAEQPARGLGSTSQHTGSIYIFGAI